MHLILMLSRNPPLYCPCIFFSLVI